MENYVPLSRMDFQQPDRRPSSTPLFPAIPTGTYTYRYRDIGRYTKTEDSSLNAQSISQDKGAIRETRNKIETDEAAIQPYPSSTERLPDDDEEVAHGTQIADVVDPILYRETVAVSNGSMTLLSKQVGVEGPQTGAKGRAREREMRKFAAARIMPSQGLVDAAKEMGRDGTRLSYPPLTTEGYLVDKVMKENEKENKDKKAMKSDEILLVGCGLHYERRSRERGRAPAYPYHVSNAENSVMIGEKLASGTKACRLLAHHPVDEFSHPNPERERRQLERFRLLEENVRLRNEVDMLEEEAARRGKETLRENNMRLREELTRLRGDAEYDEEMEAVYQREGRSEINSSVLWKDAGLGNQPRRTANRGNRIGASLMSQEVMVEHPSAGKGRAREREEKRRLESLACEPSKSDSDTDEMVWRRKRGTNWRGRIMTDFKEDEDKYGNKNKGDIDTGSDGEHREQFISGNASKAAAALANLSPDVLAKYGPNRPPRIWREHSHETLVERNDGGGSKGRRREVALKNEEAASASASPRFVPQRSLVNAAKRGNGLKCDDDGENGRREMEMYGDEDEVTRRFYLIDMRKSDTDNEEEPRGRGSIDGMLAKYAADRPPRLFRDGGCEVLVEGELAGRSQRREGVFREQLPDPRFMPSQEEMAEAAATANRGENAFLDSDSGDRDT